MKVILILLILFPSLSGFGQESKTLIVADDLRFVTDFVQTLNPKLTKSEFETEDEFLKRIGNLLSETKYKGKKLNEVVFEIRSEMKYDAETQTFSPKESVSFSYSTSPNKFSYELMFVDREDFAWNNIDSPRLEFKTSPEKAKEIKTNLKFAAFGYPVFVGIHDKQKTLYFVPAKFVLFNSATGEIYIEKKIKVAKGWKTVL